MDEATVILVICIGAIGLAIRAFETAFLVIVSLSQLIEDHLWSDVYLIVGFKRYTDIWYQKHHYW